MSDRKVQAAFGRPRNHKHVSPGFFSGVSMFLYSFWEIFINAPRLVELFFFYRFRKKKSDKPRVVLFSDNLDEVNGIAVNSRLILQELRKQGRNVYLMGVAFHTRDNGVMEENGTILLPQVFSMEQVGYKDSEMAVPSLREVCVWLRRYPVDLMELETPSAGAFLALLLCKALGIKVISHYRTDMFYYTELLTNSSFPVLFMKFWIRIFMRLSTPVIVPSKDFFQKMIDEVYLKADQVRIIDRGINLERFAPEKAKGLWQNHSPENKTRFLFVGRVSREKELEFLLDCWKQFRSEEGDAELMIVGSGPFLEEMKTLVSLEDQVFFAGRQTGDDLSSYYAESDYFVFPSGSDTFGNVVVEALASGSPSIVSDSGGPKDIVGENEAGWVLPFKDKQEWVKTFHKATQISKTKEGKALSENAIRRSKRYTLENSAKAFWSLYEEVLNAR